MDQAERGNGGHGRVEIRRYRTISDAETLAHLDREGEWAGLRSIGMVEAEGRAVRGDWGIENGLHRVLAMAFREDESRVRAGHGAENLIVLRHRVVNRLKRERRAKVGIKAQRLKAGWDEQYLLKILAQYDAFALWLRRFFLTPAIRRATLAAEHEPNITDCERTRQRRETRIILLGMQRGPSGWTASFRIGR